MIKIPDYAFKSNLSTCFYRGTTCGQKERCAWCGELEEPNEWWLEIVDCASDIDTGIGIYIHVDCLNLMIKERIDL